MRVILAAIALVALLATACGGSKGSVLEKLPAEEATATAAATETSDAPLPVRTPTPVPTPAGPPGRVITNVTAVCRLGETDAIIYVTYRAQAIGTEMHRVRLLLNNKVADDSGDIFGTTFEKNTTVHVVSGKRYTLTLSVTAPNALVPQVTNIVGCPGNAGPQA